MTQIVLAEHLTKKYGNLVAVDNIDFQVNQGECFGFLGPNGAGKTTTMKMIYCVLPKTSGKLEVMGLDVDTYPREIKEIVGVAPQENNLDPDFSVYQNLIVYSRYFNIPKEEAEERADKLLDFIQLQDKRDVIIEKLSSGMKRRLILARALLNKPKILILDEPTTGLDPQARHLIWEKLRQLKREGVTIILTTHYMEEASQLCDRLVIMDYGRILIEGTPYELIEKFIGKEVLEITGNGEIVSYLHEKSAGLEFEAVGDKIYIFADEPETLLAGISKKFRVEQAIVRRATLEDVFLKLTGRGLRE
ncbi:MAG: ATP-binding cassette domain-containing protein [Candidatus Bathyarchaeia archaeon]